MVMTRWSCDVIGSRCEKQQSLIIILNAYLIRAASVGCLQASPGTSAKNILRTYHRNSILVLPWSSIRRRGSMDMLCFDNIGRESWEWVVTTFGRLSKLMLPHDRGKQPSLTCVNWPGKSGPAWEEVIVVEYFIYL